MSKMLLSISLILSSFLLSCDNEISKGSSSSTYTGNSSYTESQMVTPAAPYFSSCKGSLNKISLSWYSSYGAKGYNVYKSTDGKSFVKINSTLIITNSYNDIIDSEEGDGVYFYYRITAVADKESLPSSVLKNIHGQRLKTSYASSLYLEDDLTYILEGHTNINGSLYINSGAKLYLLDNSKIEVAKEAVIKVGEDGLLSVLASNSRSVIFTTNTNDLDDGEGFGLIFESCNEKTLIQNSKFNNIDTDTGIEIHNCSPTIKNNYFVANSLKGTSFFSITGYTGSDIQNNNFKNITLLIGTNLRAFHFKLEYNIFRNSYFAMSFIDSTPFVYSGQIENNIFHVTTVDGRDGRIYFYTNDKNSYNVDLDKNYWLGGVPTVYYAGVSGTSFNFITSLSVAPVGMGPNW